MRTALFDRGVMRARLRLLLVQRNDRSSGRSDGEDVCHRNSCKLATGARGVRHALAVDSFGLWKPFFLEEVASSFSLLHYTSACPMGKPNHYSRQGFGVKGFRLLVIFAPV
jgi:hypothetical protein